MDHSEHSAMNHSMHGARQATGHQHHGVESSSTGHSHEHNTGTDSECSFEGHSMMMFFHSGYCEIVLFNTWKVTSFGTLIGSMIGIFIMAALYEGLKYYREYLFWRTYNALQYRSVSMPPEKGVVSEDNRIVQPTMFSLMHGFQTFLHVVQIVLSYFLMLIFMTYNIWLCIAVVAGAATGYFLFGWKKSVIVDVTEHCH